jgi:DNA polymerase-1
MRKCDKCHLGKNSRNKRMNHWIMGEGNTDNKIMFVGDVIGQQDAVYGSPISGVIGMLLSECVEKAGYKLNDVYRTTLLKCMQLSKGNPKPPEVLACKDYLEDEIFEIKPKVIVPLGAVATKYFLGNKKISDVRGYVFDDIREGIRIMPTYHPSSLIKRPANLFEFQSDIYKAFRVLEGKYKPIPRKYIYTEDFQKVYNLVSKCNSYAFDIETTGLNTYNDNIVTCSFSFAEGSSICIPFNQEWYKKIFALNIRSVSHTKFDVLFLKNRYGIEVQNWYFDTYAAIGILNDNVSHGLKTLASVYTDVPYYNLESKLALDKEDINKVALYNNFDTDVTFRLYNIFKDWIVIDGYEDLFFKTIMPVNRMLIDIESTGITIDINRLKNLSLNKNLECVRIKRKLNDISPINWNSTKQVGEVLYKDLKLKCPSKTPTGAPCTNEAALKILENKHEAPKLLLELRHLVKGLGTYLTGVINKKEYSKVELIKTELQLLEYSENLSSYTPDYNTDLFKLLQYDGKIHNSNNINGTVSGRLTSPLHTIPREGGYRELFTTEQGFMFVGMDYKQFELRIAAYLAKENKLIEILDSPDVKQQLTKMIINLDYTEDIWTQIKGVIYGVLYGRGSESIAIEFDMEAEFAEELKKGFFRNFKNVKKMLNGFRDDALFNGEIVDIVGRKRRFITKQYNIFDMDGDIFRQSVNFPIQAGSSAIFWPKVLDCHNYLKYKKSKVIHTKHDAVYFKIHQSEEDLIEKCKSILEKNTLIGDVLVDVKVGRNWGEC